VNIGYINCCDNLKGFGFIRREKGRDLIFSISDIIDNPYAIDIPCGLKVSFSLEKTKKGFRAVEIKII